MSVLMSSAQAKLKFSDGEIWYAKYDGTCDQVYTKIYADYTVCRADWQSRAETFPDCTCGGTPESVSYAEAYGTCSHGPMTACRACGVLVDRSAYYEDEDMAYGPNRGLPGWWFATPTADALATARTRCDIERMRGDEYRAIAEGLLVRAEKAERERDGFSFAAAAYQQSEGRVIAVLENVKAERSRLAVANEELRDEIRVARDALKLAKGK